MTTRAARVLLALSALSIVAACWCGWVGEAGLTITLAILAAVFLSAVKFGVRQ